MIVILKNFRCWENQTFEFPDDGLTLLSGKSGVGKSSILQAIHFCLFGKGTKIVKLGTTTCKVEIRYKDLHVVRTKKPSNKLVVNDVFEDDVAQEIINKRFGINFSVVSYLEQDVFKSIVYMSPSSRLEFLETFAFENFNIEGLKNNVNEKLKACDLKLSNKRTEIEVLTKTIDLIKKPEYVERPTEDEIHVDNYTTELLILKNKKGLFEKSLDNINRILKSNEVINTKIQVESQCLESYTAQLNESRFIGTEQLNELEKRYVLYKKSEKVKAARQELETLEKEFNEQMELHTSTRGSQIECLRNLILSPEVKKDTFEKLSQERDQDYINRKFKEVTERLEKIQPYYNEYLELVPHTGKVVSCPSCRCSLSIVNDKIFQLKDNRKVNVERVKKLEKIYIEYNDLKKLDYKYRDTDTCRLEEIVSSNEILEEKLRVLLDDELPPHLETIRNKITELRSKYDLCDEVLSIIQFTDTDLQTLMEQRVLNKEYSTYKNKIDQTSNVIINLKSQIQHCPQDIYSSELLTINKSIEELTERVSRADLISSQWKTYNKYIEDIYKYEKLMERNFNSLKELVSLENDYKYTYNLKSIILESENEYLSNIIENINIHASSFIEDFFTDKPINVKLVPFKEVKKGKTTITKPQITLEITYNGTEIEFDSLSGGEKARISLAYTLALSMMNSSPLLIMDESISSLDEETTSDVLESIKTHLTSKTVLCVSHQANTGMFDNVIDI